MVTILHLEVYGCGAFVLLLELVILAGQDGVERNTYKGRYSQTGQRYDADVDASDGVVDADCEHKNQRRDNNIAAVREIDLVLNHIAHADRRDHTVQDKGHTADGRGRHCGYESGKLWAEGEDYSKDCRDADYAGVIDLAQRKNAGILAVGCVRGSAEQRR